MDMSVLSSLSPEERAALLAALQQEPEPDPVEQLTSAVQYLCGELDAVKKAHDALKALVMDDMIGGIKEAFESNQRAEQMNGFKGKYGSALDPFAGKFKDLYGKDLHEHTFDTFGSDGEGLDEKIASLVEELKAKIGLPPETPAVVTATAEPAEDSADEEPNDVKAAYAEIEKQKRRDDSREARRKGA